MGGGFGKILNPAGAIFGGGGGGGWVGALFNPNALISEAATRLNDKLLDVVGISDTNVGRILSGAGHFANTIEWSVTDHALVGLDPAKQARLVYYSIFDPKNSELLNFLDPWGFLNAAVNREYYELSAVQVSSLFNLKDKFKGLPFEVNFDYLKWEGEKDHFTILKEYLLKGQPRKIKKLYKYAQKDEYKSIFGFSASSTKLERTELNKDAAIKWFTEYGNKYFKFWKMDDAAQIASTIEEEPDNLFTSWRADYTHYIFGGYGTEFADELDAIGTYNSAIVSMNLLGKRDFLDPILHTGLIKNPFIILYQKLQKLMKEDKPRYTPEECANICINMINQEAVPVAVMETPYDVFNYTPNSRLVNVIDFTLVTGEHLYLTHHHMVPYSSHWVSFRMTSPYGTHRLYVNLACEDLGCPNLFKKVSVTDNYKILPVIPLKINGKNVAEDLDTKHKLGKLWHKTIGKKRNLYSLLDQIKNHPQKDDINSSYLMFGIPLDAQDRWARQYIFNFFDYFHYEKQTEKNLTREARYVGFSVKDGHHISMQYTWDGIIKRTIPGKYKNQKGKYYVEVATLEQDVLEEISGSTFAKGTKVYRIVQQKKDYYIQIDVVNLLAWTQVKEEGVQKRHLGISRPAIGTFNKTGKVDKDDPNEVSSILLPLIREVIFKAYRNKNNQHGGGGLYLFYHLVSRHFYIVNTLYKAQKKPILADPKVQESLKSISGGLYVGSIILTIFFPPAGAAASSAASALANASSTIAASITANVAMQAAIKLAVNYAIRWIATKAIMWALSKALGKIMHPVLLQFASVLISSVVFQALDSKSLTSGFVNTMTDAKFWLNCTNSVTTAYSAHQQTKLQNLVQTHTYEMQKYQEASDKIRSVLSGWDLQENRHVFSYQAESPDTFLTRTLLVGSDISNLSINSLFNQLDLKLPKAIS